MAAPLYFDDLAVGQKHTTASVAVTFEGSKEFAAEFDPQAFHLDDVAARDSLFGRLAASGWYTASLSMRLLVQGGLNIAGGLVGLACDLKWPQPTYPGDTLRVESEVLALRISESNPKRGIVTVRNSTLNQRNEPVQVAVVKMLVPLRVSRRT